MAGVAEQHGEYAREMRGQDESIVLYDVPWWTYVMLRDSLDERGSHVRLTYLEGALEIMSPSGEHEEDKV